MDYPSPLKTNLLQVDLECACKHLTFAFTNAPNKITKTFIEFAKTPKETIVATTVTQIEISNSHSRKRLHATSAFAMTQTLGPTQKIKEK